MHLECKAETENNKKTVSILPTYNKLMVSCGPIRTLYRVLRIMGAICHEFSLKLYLLRAMAFGGRNVLRTWLV